MSEQTRAGIEYLETMTELLQRVRSAHPLEGIYEAAELQWWWSVPRPTDEFPQLFWFDDSGRPDAAFVMHDFSYGSSALYGVPTIVIVVMPGAGPDRVATVVDRGLAHLAAHRIDEVELEVDRADDLLRRVLFDRGFTVKGDGMADCWLSADVRPPVSPLSAGYRLLSRSETEPAPHHMERPDRPDVERRLRQTSLYRADLDLVVLDPDGEVAGYGMFWHDPITSTGVVEPMRTLDGHRRHGLARHVLTAGIERLAEAGASRISIGYEPDNPASGPLYRSIGFESHRRTDVLVGPVPPPA